MKTEPVYTDLARDSGRLSRPAARGRWPTASSARPSQCPWSEQL